MKKTLIALAAAATLALATVSPAHAAARHVVTITGTSTGAATYTVFANDISSQKTRTSYKRSFTKHSYTYYSIDVSDYDDGSKVACRITVDGRTVKHKSASGDYASVHCSYSVLG